MSTVIVVRPGSTDFDEQNRIQGALDLPLNSHGESQVKEILEALADSAVEVVYTGPCEPARSTAAAIAEKLGISVKESNDLRNLNQGLWQGLPVCEIRRKFPKAYKQWQESPKSICPPEGEMVPLALERIRKALHKPLKRKTQFAVVVPEPLASLVACVVRGSEPELSVPICGDSNGQLVEFIETNGYTPPNGRESAAALQADGGR